MSGYTVPGHTAHRGRHLLNTPGPTNVPEQVLRAMMRNPLDLNDPAVLEIIASCLRDLKTVFRTAHEMFIYAANGHGAWEAALVNTMSPGDLLLVPECGHFSSGWGEMARLLQLRTESIGGDWRRAVDPAAIRARLAADKAHEIKGLLVVQTDTATSVTSDVAAIRRAIDEAGHPALLLVDTIPTLAVTDFRMDEWGVDVAVAACQKGLMMPPGLSFVAASPKALERHRGATSQRRYWDWSPRLELESYRMFCGTSPQSQLYGLRAALDMLLEEGLEAVFARHRRFAEATRRCVARWGEAGAMELNPLRPAEYADGVTTILLHREHLAEGIDASRLRDVCRDEFRCALGGGLGALHGRAFRIGHMGDMNEAMLYGALSTVEATLSYLDIPHEPGGVTRAIDYLVGERKAGSAH